MSQPEPKILAFLCNWCSYAGADLCGVSRYQYPPNIRVVRVMCSTRLDPILVLQVLKEGVDGVFIGGCHLGDCHYMAGNYHTLNKITLVKMLIKKAGLDPDRLKLEWVSASEGQRFSVIITDFTEKVKALGPNVAATDNMLKARLDAAIDAASGMRLRTLVGRMHQVTDSNNVYHCKFPKARMDTILDEATEMEFYRNLVLRNILAQPKSVKQLAKDLDMQPDKVLECITALRADNKIGDAGHEGRSPLYLALKVGGE